MRPRVLAYILFCKPKLTHRYVKPDLQAGETDNLPPGRERILRLRLAFILQGSLSQSRKIYASPSPEGLEQREKKWFEVMEDALTLVLIIVLCLLLKPLVAAILRGLGSSEHRRDR